MVSLKFNVKYQTQAKEKSRDNIVTRWIFYCFPNKSIRNITTKMQVTTNNTIIRIQSIFRFQLPYLDH